MRLPNRDYAVLDVETTMIKDGEIPKTKFWGLYDGHIYRKFNTTNALLRYLEKARPLTLLHHSNFDVIQLLVDGADIAILKSHNNRLIKCSLGDHVLLNSYSCFPISLGEVFAAFGYKKSSLGQLEKRNYDDCVLGLECFLKLDSLFEQLAGVSVLQKGTIAATGFGAAEKIAGRLPKDLRFLDSYRGGRVEVYDLRYHGESDYAYWQFCKKYRKENNGKEFPYARIHSDVDKHDICSSYPESFVECPKQSKLLLVKVKTSDFYAPLFDRNNIEMLHFPNGVFSSYVYSDVLEKYILPNSPKTKIKIIRSSKIDLEWITRLKGFVLTIYEKKQNSTGGIRLVCKLLLNSLYGRIGLKGESERARVLNYRPDGDDIAVYYLGRKRWIAFDKILRPSRSNFPFAAYITDNARGRLFQGFTRNNALYGDTDSIFSKVSKQTFSEPVGNALGQWDHQGREKFQATNVKDYTFGKDEVRKGGGDFVTWTLKKFAQKKSAESVHRTRQTSLRKRVVLADGSTRPHIIGV